MQSIYCLISNTYDYPDFKRSDLTTNDFRLAFDVWAKLKGEAEMPTSQVLDIRSLNPVLSNLALVKFEHDPFRIKYLVAGSHLVSLYGKEVTGRYVDEVYPCLQVVEVTGVYKEVMESGKPHFSRREFVTPFRNLGYERLILPFSDYGGVSTHALLCLYPTNPKLRTATDWQSHDDVQYWLNQINAGRTPSQV